MKIAVNTRLLLPGKLDGIGWFSYQVLRRITANHPEHQFLFLFDRPYDSRFIFNDNVIPLVISPPARHPLLWYLWMERMIPRTLKKFGADVFFSPDGFIPLSLRIPVISVIHDINFHHRPMDLPVSSRVYYRHFFPRFAQKSTRIATVSEFSKTDIVTSYNIDPSKIDVVYNGAHELYKPLSDQKIEEVKREYSNGADFFIFIGNLHPRKNVDGLLKAFDLFRKQTSLLFKLVIVGERFFMNRSLENIYDSMLFKHDVVFTGRKEPEELSKILGAAWALAFVPHYEGFGIPLLEAMQCDVPSVASCVTSIPEVAGQTAIYADPSDIHSVADALTQMATDAGLRKQLIRNCRLQRQLFSWDTTAEKVWRTIEEVPKFKS